MKDRRWILAVFSVFLLVGFLFLIVWMNPTQGPIKEVATGIPKFELDLEFVSLTDINEGPKDTKYSGNNLTVRQNGESKTFYDVEIRGRGNSTWSQPKKPYRLKFSKKANLLDMGKGRKWVLLADYLDASHLRNHIAFFIEGLLNERFAKQGRFAELSIEGAELGLYYVTSQVEIDKNSVDLRDPMGILVEVDNLHGLGVGCYRSKDEMCITVQDLVNEENKKLAVQDFLSSFNALETAAEAGDYKKVSEFIDVESFATYFLLSEFTVDPDAYTTSWFLYKDGLNDKIHAGPGWDFDLALGNKKWIWTDNESFHSPFNTMVRKSEVFSDEVNSDFRTSKLMYYLVDIPEFMNEVKQIYNKRMSGRWPEVISYLDESKELIREAAIRDNEAWEADDFEKEVDYLKDWLEKRYQHFEGTYGLESL